MLMEIWCLNILCLWHQDSRTFQPDHSISANIWDTTLVLPRNKYINMINKLYAKPNYAVFHSATAYTVMCNHTELYALVRHNGTSLITKAMSVMRHYYPWTRHYYPWTRHHLTDRSRPIAMESYCKYFKNLSVAEEEEMSETDTTNFQLYITTLMLMSAYSRPGEFPKQIESRFKALKASYDTAMPSHIDATTVIANLNINVKNRMSILFEAAGYWLSVDKDGNYNQKLTLEELGNPVNFKESGILEHHFPMALMEQGRLVYLNCGLTTTQWALDVSQRAKAHTAGLSSGWASDIKVLETIADLITSYPYTGLRITQHEAIQTQKFPRMAMLGVSVRKKMLDATQAAELENYVTSSFTANLQPQEMNELEVLTLILSGSKEETYLSLIHLSPLDIAEDLVARLTPNLVERIKRRLYAMPNMGA
ncbi:uncharacterized protein [Palaemon carinicauda]|uniref:uncharacterized protein n=1 Tax=Palaemon carinicauda TaxID=392227 RepID=UPI0035B5F455